MRQEGGDLKFSNVREGVVFVLIGNVIFPTV